VRTAARLLVGALVLAGPPQCLLTGCTPPKVYWTQRVRVNGKDFVFQRIESLLPQGHRVSYLNGGFVVEGPGPVAVNGFEISVKDGEVLLANQRIADLRAGEEVYFPADMKWRVRASSGSDSP
jgi:hypothetical protein